MRSPRLIGALLTLVICLLFAPGPVFAEDVHQLTYRNPLMDTGLADPAVIKASDGRYYMINTFGFTIHSSDDLVDWKIEGSGNPSGTWGVADFWAPELIEHGGLFYLFYSAERREGGKRIGVAVSDRPTGGFKDLGKPLFDFGYPVIDAHPFIDDDGRIYLFFAKDQVSTGVRHESHIYGVELARDMMSVIGEPVLLSRPQQPWEFRSGSRAWNEGPYVIKNKGIYYLMFSANCFCGRDYSVGYATSTSPLGPYVKYEDNPILSRGSWMFGISGPGHHSVVPSPDGSELFMVYHIHADPLVGGGDRRLSIDRMGFRPDGSLYVSGPTLTSQPVPSGATMLVNVARTARVTVSSVKPDYDADALIDGEVVVDAFKQRHEWVSNGEQQGAWVRLSWDEPQRVRALFVYGSVLTARRMARGTVRLSDGSEIVLQDLPEEPGAAAIVELPADRDIDWLEIVFDEMQVSRGEAGLSEVVVLGYPVGSVWLSSPWFSSPWLSSPRVSSPESDSTLATAEVRVEAHGVPVKQVTVKLNDQVIYQGDRLPQDMTFSASAMQAGTHALSAIVTDQTGTEYTASAEFTVAHVKLDSLPWGARISKKQMIQPQLVIPASDLSYVSLTLWPVGENHDLDPVRLYDGKTMPDQLIVDTLTIPDGAFDLKVEVETTQGIVSTLETRLVIDNWEVLHDPIKPPTESNWFGFIDQLKTVDKSGEWEHRVGDETSFFGDGERIRPGSDGGFLTWQLDRLYDFELTVYVRDDVPLDVASIQGDMLSDLVSIQGDVFADFVSIRVSPDGVRWTDVAYDIQRVNGPNQQRWSQVKLSGLVPIDATYLRFELPGDLATELPSQLPSELPFEFPSVDFIEADFNWIELGDVMLRGTKG